MQRDQPEAAVVRMRAFVIGIIGAAITGVLVTWAELVLSGVRIGYLQLPPAAIAGLLLALALSTGMKRLLGERCSLSAGEIAVVYVMCVVAAMTSSHGILQKLIPLLVAPNYAADRSNNWASLFFAHIPSWSMPWNTHGAAQQPVAKAFYEGLASGRGVPWAAWTVPCLFWGLFLSLVMGAMFCLAVILRRQWADNERLSFPLARLPLEILGQASPDPSVEATESFWRNPVMWIGVAIPVLLYGIDWLHEFFPAVPLIATSVTLNDYLIAAPKPWSELDYTPLIFSFAALGFFYLLPTDILLSIWFFFLLARSEQMVAVTFNMDTPRMPMQNVYLFQGYQTLGAYLVFGGYLIWIARPHLARVWAQATAPGAPADGEMLSYRHAVWGLVSFLCGAAALLVVLGMSPWFAAIELIGGILVIGLVMARSTAEAGMLMTETTWSPIDFCAMFGGLHGVGASNLALAPFVDHLIVHDQRGLLLTGILDSAQIGRGIGVRARTLLIALVTGIVVALAVAGPLQIWLPYNYGGQKMDYWMESLSPQSQFTRYASALVPGAVTLQEPWQASVFFTIGALTTWGLVAMRSMFYWWPLHPLGFALAGSWSSIQFWFPCLVAWVLKSLTVRYGGLSFYTRARPFFLGLIVGEFGMAVLSVLASVVAFQASHGQAHIPTPPFPWQ